MNFVQDADGQYFLGICYENGWGVESDDDEAGKFYQAAADLGHDGAMYNLAAFHEYGLGGNFYFSFSKLYKLLSVVGLVRVLGLQQKKPQE